MNYEFLYSFTKRVLSSHESISWVGITNKYSVLLATEQRPGSNAFLTDEENEEFSSSSITRHRKITKLEPKIGKVRYAFGRYKNLCRATIPINEDFYLLLMFDSASRDFDDLITAKIIPMIENEKLRFVATSD
jgi:hypothetical protein